MKKLNILFQTPSYLPINGGIQQSTHELAKELIKQGHDISVICEKTSSDLKDYEIMNNIKVYRFPKISLPFYFKSMSFGYKKKKIHEFLKEFLKDKQYDLIVSRFPFFVEPTKKINPNTPLIFLQPSVVYIATKKVRENSKNWIVKFNQIIRTIDMFNMEKKAINLADLILVRNNAMKKIDIDKLDGDENKFGLFTQGVDHKRFKYGVKMKKFIKEMNLENKKIILTVSRLSSDKNNKGLVKIFSEIKEPEVVLVIVGGGGDYDEIKKMSIKLGIQNRVILTGDRKDVEKFYNIADIFILASKQEGFGNVFLEAMASGLPILGFKANPPKIVTAVQEIANKNQAGFAVENEKEMIEKINLLLNNEKLRRKMSDFALKESKKYTWENMTKIIIDSYKKIK
jgi:glycosyltransferase involved in cell wall biosynthesis